MSFSKLQTSCHLPCRDLSVPWTSRRGLCADMQCKLWDLTYTGPFINYVQSFAESMHLSVRAKGQNTFVNVRFQFVASNTFAKKI